MASAVSLLLRAPENSGRLAGLAAEGADGVGSVAGVACGGAAIPTG